MNASGLRIVATALSGGMFLVSGGELALAQNYVRRVDQARDTVAVEQALQQPYLPGVTPTPKPLRRSTGASRGLVTTAVGSGVVSSPGVYGTATARAGGYRNVSTAGSSAAFLPPTGVAPSYSMPARTTAGVASLSGLRSALTMYYLDTGRYPATAEGLNALLVAPAGVKNWRGPYITVSSGQAPLADPWGNTYRLVDITPYKGAVPMMMIKSNGPDGLPDTADDLSINL